MRPGQVRLNEIRLGKNTSEHVTLGEVSLGKVILGKCNVRCGEIMVYNKVPLQALRAETMVDSLPCAYRFALMTFGSLCTAVRVRTSTWLKGRYVIASMDTKRNSERGNSELDFQIRIV